MSNRLLVALDDSENALRAVDFVCRHFTNDHAVTLMSVIPDTAAICDMNSPGLTPYFMSQKETFCVLEEKHREIVESALEYAKDRLVRAGFSEGNVTIRMETQKEGVAQDILAEAAGGYSAVVLGRSGSGGLRGFFLGSVSQKVFNAVSETPVILVP